MLTVDTDTELRGRLVAAGRVVVNLWFDGDIACSHLVIGPNGYLTGSAAAREIIVEGQVTGPIHASSVTLKGGCIVEGDVHHTTITIEPGATMTGRASRFPVIQLPAELLQLEAKAEADRVALEDAEYRSFEPDPAPLKQASMPGPQVLAASLLVAGPSPAAAGLMSGQTSALTSGPFSGLTTGPLSSSLASSLTGPPSGPPSGLSADPKILPMRRKP